MTAELRQALEALTAIDQRIETLTREMQAFLLMEVAGRMREKVIESAQAGLESSLDQYLEALTPVTLSGDQARFALEGSSIANMLEGGASPYDMRDALLQGKDSRVVRIRSKWPETTRGGTRENFGRAVDKPYRQQLGRNEARRIGRQVLRELSAGRGPVKAGRAPKLRPHHATDLFDRMRREPGASRGGRRTGQYVIYRTITRSNTGGWIHPGIEARDFFGKAQEQIDEITRSALDGLVKGILG